ncbi:MAG: SDR family oxidoreductase [Steroidobacteraceae bacterium]
MKKLLGMTAIVTGAGQGVGLGIAKALAGEGANLVLTGRQQDKLQRAAAELQPLGVRVLTVAGDARQRQHARDAVAAAIEGFGRLDVLVNNAQSTAMGPVESISEQDIDQTLGSGFLGTLYCMQAAFPHLKAAGGSIINLGSAEGIRSSVNFGIYAANKEAIRSLSRVAAREWGQYRIRVNVICPAALSPAAEQYVKDHPAAWEQTRKGIALGHLGDPATEIGPVAAFLAGPDSIFVTGQTVNADGGIIML